VLSGFSGEIALFDALEQMLPRLAQLHLHDAPQWQAGTPVIYGKDHQALGAGNLETGRLLDRLAEAQFSGPIVLELTIEEALASMQVIRQIRPNLLDN
jgi:sugar phosphate isomerase/epimerase